MTQVARTLTHRKIMVALSLVVAGIYLFVNAPPPLPDETAPRNATASRIPVKVLLDSANVVNAAARRIYTERIVTKGQEAGLTFREDWQRPEVQAGPLPALFLRMVSMKLQQQGSSLGLFLGSDQPIVSSNAFKGEQVRYFESLKEDLKPRYFEMPSLERQVALYADIAVTKGCVSCHNEHPNTPKRDWKLGDVMGATTWTYPSAMVNDQELREGIAQTYDAVERAYMAFLEKAGQFDEPPFVGQGWPEQGRRQVPDAATFMAAVREATAPSILATAVLMQ